MNFEAPPNQTPFGGDPPTGISWPWLRWFSRISEILSNFSGILSDLSGPVTTYIPVITAGSGTFTTISATGRYRRIGKLVFIQITITITTNGTAAGYVLVTLPFASVNTTGVKYVLTGRGDVVSGKALQASIGPNSSSLFIFNFDNTYPGASGETLVLSGFYETP